MTAFPYSGKSAFASSSDPNVTRLQTAVSELQELFLGLSYLDSSLRVLAGFEGNLKNLVGSDGVSTGPLRYLSGRYGSGALVEGAGSNLLINPSAEVDTVGWTLPDSSVSLVRDGIVYTANGTVSTGSFKLTGTGDAGSTRMKTTLTVNPGTNYSASVYLYAPPGSTSKGRIELSFSGGTPASASSGDTALAPGGWTRVRVENVNSGNNSNGEVSVVLSRQAPGFTPGSRLSTIGATSTADVLDGAMTINTGDICMCASSANPGQPRYAWHMVTSGATGVVNSALRLNDKSVSPTFVPGTRFSRLAPASGDSVPVSDTGLALIRGDLVFCNLGSGYGWHVVSTTATGASQSNLRLDDAPSAPRYGGGSRLTRMVPVSSASVTDSSMVLNAGDLVFARTLNNPAGSGYGWHVVTAGATGVNSPNLRLDGASSAPTFATGSVLSNMGSTVTGSDTDTSAVLDPGAFAFVFPTRNPAGNGYGWHMVTTGATGVSSSSLRLDHASSETVNADCIQLEAASSTSSYIDSYQGSGFAGIVGAVSSRSATTLSYDTGTLPAATSTVAFWMYPLWEGSDNQEHVLFDLANGDEQDRIRLAKDGNNKMVLSVYDASGGLMQLVSDAPVGSIAREVWHHVAFTLNAGTLQMYLDGMPLSATGSGSGTGQVTSLGRTLFLGSDYRGLVTRGTAFDDLVVSGAVMSAAAIRRLASGTNRFMGVSLVRQARGSATSAVTPGDALGVPHGLSLIPGSVMLTPRSNATVYLSAPSDSVNFYVAASAASVDFDWQASA